MSDLNDISNSTILRILSLTGLFILGALILISVQRELVWLVVSFFLAVAINPPVEYLSRYLPRKSRLLATSIVMLAFLLLIVIMLVTLVPPMIAQTQVLVKKLPDLANTLQESNSPVGHFVQNYNLVPLIKNNQSRFTDGITAVGGSAVDLARIALSSIAATLSILALTFFMSVEGPRWLKVIWRQQPKNKLRHREKLATDMYHAVTGWVNGNLLTSLIAAVATSIMLAVIGVPFSIPLGLVVGFFDLLPLIGATVGALIVVLVCLFSSVTAAVVMLIFFLVYQQLENHVLQPYVYSKTVELSPLLVLASALLGAALGGLVGALLAIPITACIQIVLKDNIHIHQPPQE
jgi:predicted PurR-regulated permease PerM